MSEETKRAGGSSHDPARTRNLITRGRLVWRLIGDRRVPLLLKSLPLLTLLYLISPIDLLPALAMGPLAPLGALDDLGVILLGLNFFISLAPSDVVAEHEAELSSAGDASGAARSGEAPPIVEGSYRIVDDEEG